MTFHLAQANIAIAKFRYDEAEFAGFVDNLDRIYELAERSPGFVWRYVSQDEDAEAKAVFAQESLIFNMSLWKSMAELHDFVYNSDHLEILQQRADWFVPYDRPSMALWWQPAGQIPTVSEARHRIDCLAQAGPTADAFTFRNAFDAPEQSEPATHEPHIEAGG